MNSKRTDRNQQISDLVFASIIIAIILILTVTFGYLNTNGIVNITIVHIPVLVGTVVLGKKYGLLFGTVYGLGSMIMAFILQAQNIPFTNPLLSVLPRVIFGYLIVFIYDFFTKIFKTKYASVPFTMGVATLVHTLLVLPLLYLFVENKFYFLSDEFIFDKNPPIFVFFWAVITTNAILEIILAVTVGSAATIPLLLLKEKYE